MLLPHLAAVIVEEAEVSGDCVWLRARARAGDAACPRCACSSGKVHSTYQRRLSDAAIGGRRVRILLRIRRLFCVNPGCRARTFAEQADGLTSRRSRKTPPLARALASIALALAGRAGARLAARAGPDGQPVQHAAPGHGAARSRDRCPGHRGDR